MPVVLFWIFRIPAASRPKPTSPFNVAPAFVFVEAQAKPCPCPRFIPPLELLPPKTAVQPEVFIAMTVSGPVPILNVPAVVIVVGFVPSPLIVRGVNVDPPLTPTLKVSVPVGLPAP